MNSVIEFEDLVREFLPPAMGFKIDRSFTTSGYELVFYKKIYITDRTLLPYQLDTLSEHEMVELIKRGIESIKNNTNKVENLLMEGENS